MLITSELIDEAEKLIGAAGMPAAQINYNKLLRWQREGLLPRQIQSGVGPGGRQESLWDKSCIEQLQIIVGCVKGNRLNRKAAEHALIAAGCWIRGDLLKKHLLAFSKQMSVDLKKQQRSDCTDPVDRAANLERSTSDRMSAHGEFVKQIFAVSRLGFTGLDQEAQTFKSLASLTSLYQPQALQDLIEKIQPEQLEITYQNPLVISLAAFIVCLFNLIYGQNKVLHLPRLIDNAFLTQMLSKLAPKPDGKLRRKKLYPYSKQKARYNAHIVATIMYLVLCQNKEILLPLIPFIVMEMLNNKELEVPENLKNILNTELEKTECII